MILGRKMGREESGSLFEQQRIGSVLNNEWVVLDSNLLERSKLTQKANGYEKLSFHIQSHH